MPAQRWCLVVWLALCSLGCPPSTNNPPEAPLAPLPASACATLGPGELLLPESESAGDYDDELAAVDLSVLPPTVSLARLSSDEQVLVRFMLEQREGEVFSTAVVGAQGPLARAVLGSFALHNDGGVDGAFLRRGLHRFYACARGFPLTLDAFYDQVSDFRLEEPSQVVDSRVKGLQRRIRRNGQTGVFVAETLLAEGVVRETEIILSDRRNDGALDFLEYGQDGRLRSASAVLDSSAQEVIGAVPFACISCHNTRDVSPP